MKFPAHDKQVTVLQLAVFMKGGASVGPSVFMKGPPPCTKLGSLVSPWAVYSRSCR